MANKHFRRGKKLGTSVCTYISHYALKRKKSLNNFFLDENFGFLKVLDHNWFQKTVFGLTSKKMFLLIQYLNILQFIRTVVDNMCVLFYKKSRNGCKSIFNDCDKKKTKKNILPKKVLACSKVFFLAFFNTPKLFFVKMFYYFLSHSLKMLLKHFSIFYKNKTHMLSTTVFINCKIFKYWIEKNIFFDVSPKNSFPEPNLIHKPSKNQYFPPFFFFSDFFLSKLNVLVFESIV